jgi:hypothetical protein
VTITLHIATASVLLSRLIDEQDSRVPGPPGLYTTEWHLQQVRERLKDAMLAWPPQPDSAVDSGQTPAEQSEHWLVRELIESADQAGTVQIKRSAFTADELDVIRAGLAAHGFAHIDRAPDPGVQFWEQFWESDPPQPVAAVASGPATTATASPQAPPDTPAPRSTPSKAAVDPPPYEHPTVTDYGPIA